MMVGSLLKKFLDNLVVKNKFFSKLYTHSLLQRNDSSFAKNDYGFDTKEKIYQRFLGARELSKQKNLDSKNFKKLCSRYYSNNFYLSDYYVYIMNMNKSKIQTNMPEEFKKVLQKDNIELQQKLQFIIEHPHLNRKLNDSYTNDMISRATQDLISPDINMMSVLNQKIRSNRSYKDMHSKHSHSKELAKTIKDIQKRTQKNRTKNVDKQMNKNNKEYVR